MSQALPYHVGIQRITVVDTPIVKKDYVSLGQSFQKEKKIKAPLVTIQKLFWSYHKAVLHHEAILAKVITYRGAIATTKLLKKWGCFIFIFLPPWSNINTASDYSSLHGMQICDITLSIVDVKGCGLYKIPSGILQPCSQQIAPSLCLIFKLTIHWLYSLSGNLLMSNRFTQTKPFKEPAGNCGTISLLPILSQVDLISASADYNYNTPL